MKNQFDFFPYIQNWKQNIIKKIRPRRATRTDWTGNPKESIAINPNKFSKPVKDTNKKLKPSTDFLITIH